MKSWFKSISLLTAIVALAGCSTAPAYNHLDAGARQYIQTVDSVLIAKQDRIGADIKQSNTFSQIGSLIPGSGMIPVLLDVGVNGVRSVNATKHAKPMRESLETHDYAWEFRKQIRHALANSNLEGVDEFAMVREEYPGFRGRFIEQSDADAVLIVDMRYAFTPKFDKLYVTTFAMLFPNKDELKVFQERPDRDRVIEFSDNIYRNKFAATVSTGIQDGTTSENAAYWAGLSEEELVDILETAGLLLTDKMAYDINLDDVDSDLDLVPDGYVMNTETYGTYVVNSPDNAASDTIEVVTERKPQAETDSSDEVHSETTTGPDLESEGDVTEAGTD